MRTPFALGAVLLFAVLGAPSILKVAAAGPQQHFKHPPKMSINTRAHYTATVKTNDGSFTISLLPKVAPVTVNSFVFLAQHRFFDNIVFHRIIKGFMVQTGDPTGTGTGGPGYTFKDERVTLPYRLGTVAMANAGPNTNGSQFFIVVGKTALLPPNYTIFGKVSSGMSVVSKIANTPVGPSAADPNEKSSPLKQVKMIRVTVHVAK